MSEAVRRGVDHRLDRAHNYFEQRAWAEAYKAFSLADQHIRLEADDLDQLALVAYLIGRDDEHLRTLERAYNAHIEAGQCPRAVRCAFWLGFRLLMRSEMGRANGWFARAQRLLERDTCECAERGYLLLPTVGPDLELSDYEAAYAAGAEAAAIGERLRRDRSLSASLCIRSHPGVDSRPEAVV